ncbi:hypothetical protein ASE36_00430 [Rhizobium sp. Root274]|uniref:hypothetical protein n=1 Tax=unclassified Rhizobium TaxID=2613769 RepID=UPI000714098E|nr:MULTISPECIES: hypothetical protein [unclassified Rhizobium]KQW30805.1 hypothetical protein ASC71_00430 [Rhizobium sp. Root1240]KRD32352.1 hypothetical protein ASE36_00430 [Rhizobium sp. Root274]
MSKIANTPAFPIQNAQYTDAYGGHPGMTLRQHYAGLALQGILAGRFADTIPHDDINGGGDAAFFAKQYADALIAELEKENTDA